MSQNDNGAELREGAQRILEYAITKGGQLHTASVEGELVFVGNRLVRIRTEDGRTVEIAREDITFVAEPGEEEEEEGEEEEEVKEEFEMPFVEGCCDEDEEEEEGDYGEPPEEEEE